MLEPMQRPSSVWINRDIKNDLAFRPLETALEKGLIDACYSADPFKLGQAQSGKFKMIENLKNFLRALEKMGDMEMLMERWFKNTSWVSRLT